MGLRSFLLADLYRCGDRRERAAYYGLHVEALGLLLLLSDEIPMIDLSFCLLEILHLGAAYRDGKSASRSRAWFMGDAKK